MDFVITVIRDGEIFFRCAWGWTTVSGFARRYRTWQRANAAIRNLKVPNAKYSTFDEAMNHIASPQDDFWK